MRPIDLRHVLLLMPCSGEKLPHPEQPKRLYLGPMWQTLRTHRGDLPWRNVAVLSGKYGVIMSEQFIQTYDERLTPEKADHLIAGGIHAPGDQFGRTSFRGAGPCPADTITPPSRRGDRLFDLVISAGAGEYRRVFEAFIPELRAAGLISATAPVLQVVGGIGEQRQQLGNWLRDMNKKLEIVA